MRHARTRPVLLLAAAAVLLALAGCGGDGDEKAGESRLVGAKRFDVNKTPQAVRENGNEYVFFSEFDTLRCGIDVPPKGDPVKPGAACELLVEKPVWELPAKPSDCDLEWRGSVAFFAGKKATFQCQGTDIIPHDTAMKLKDGERIEAAGISCTAEREGIRCQQLDRKHGFELSVTDYKLW